MKVSFLLISFLFVLQGNSQSLNEVKALLKNRNFQVFKLYSDSAYPNMSSSNGIIRLKISRDIVNDYKEVFFNLVDNEPTINGKYETKVYDVSVLTDSKDIFYYTISQRNYNNDRILHTKIDSFKDDSKFLGFTREFHQTYGVGLIEKDLFRAIVYGGACGIAASPTEHQELIDEYLIKNDTASILLWLQSANTEKQLYALRGFKILSNYGYTLTPEIKKIANLVKQKNGVVNTCSGCLRSIDSIKNIVAEIESFKGEYYILKNRDDQRKRQIYYVLSGLFLIFLFYYLIKRYCKSR